MSADPSTPLRSAARRATTQPTFDVMWRRGRRRRLLRHSAVVAGVTASLAGVAAIAVMSSGPRNRTIEFDPAAPPSSVQPSSVPSAAATDPSDRSGNATAPPSQPMDDAKRDGVLAAVAAMPFEQRVYVVKSVSSSEGLWAVSRPKNFRGARVRGDRSGVYGRDYVNLGEYGEVLLLDEAATRIRRAYPLPGFPPQTLLLTDTAVYCARQGDGGLPHSMLCRIDRRTRGWTARVFPYDQEVGDFRRYPDNWVTNEPVDRVLFSRLRFSNGRLVASGQGGSARVDPTTLEVIPELR